MSQYIPLALIHYLVLFSQLKGYYCYPLPSSPSGTTLSQEHPTIFDTRVLHAVKNLFTWSLLRNEIIGRRKTGTKKSIIETADNEPNLHARVDPRSFGQKLLDQAEQNAARKSDIYMNKAIDATALGVAVLKLIFGKDAKMIMKDSKESNVQASLRTKAFRPGITSWSTLSPQGTTTAERKSSLTDRTSKPRKSDKITQLNVNILKLVKHLQPVSSLTDKGNEKSRDTPVVHIKTKPKHLGRYTDNESNLAHLLALIRSTHRSTKQQKGSKKSWVLLKVPTKQPQDEIGMLTDPAKTEENSNEDSSNHDDLDGEEHKELHPEESHRKIIHKQQSSEGKSLTSSITPVSKTLKSEPVQEVNPVKTDTTAHASYEGSVKNLLNALEATAHKTLPGKESTDFKQEKTSGALHEKLELVPVKKTEENAATKDVLSGAGNTGGAVVSLDSLRQLGQLLGLAGKHSTDAKVSPYTGTADTLTLATATPNTLQNLFSAPTPTPPPPPPPPPPLPPPPPPPPISTNYSVNREMSLNRISEQLKMFAERGLRGHNEYRKLHHAEPLKWSEDLASAAEKLAYQAAKRGATTRSDMVERKGYGENVAKISNIMLENAGEEATRHWYNEKEQFTFSDPGINDATKAFTQIIWKDTKILGMGAAKDDDTGELYIVALYHPKGNDEGTLRENVQSDGNEHVDVYASIFKKSTPVHHRGT